MLTAIGHYSQQAWVNLRVAKLRTFLAILGLLVGTASIVALISCSLLATEKALAQFKAFGTNLIALTVLQPDTESHHGTDTIPLSVWTTLPTRVEHLQDIAPYSVAHLRVSSRGHLLDATIIGVDQSLLSILHIKIKTGRFISSLETFERVCVIGHGLAQAIQEFSMEVPLNKQLKIEDTLYTIVGVTNAWKGNGIFYEDIDHAVMIPIKGMPAVNKETKINNAVMRLDSENNVDAAIEQVSQLLHIQMPNISIFARSAKQIIAGVESQGKIFTLLLAVIGSISLLVGGIGVMNVMLISVSERKKEIGIRKALGARKNAIRALFLTESIILSILGGVFGVVIGVCFTLVMAYCSHWPFMIYGNPIVIGLSVSVGTGVFFGFYPAHRAAQLEPMASLRSE